MTDVATPTADRAVFRQVAAVAALVSAAFAVANLVTMFAAVRFDLNAMSHPVVLLHEGAAAARLWQWSMVFDMFGYYLLIVPAVFWLRSWLRPQGADWIELSTWSLLAYCFVGAVGAAILATAIPPLITEYGTNPSQNAVFETVFNGYANSVYRGMWNLLEELLAGVGWIGIGIVLRSDHRRLGTTTIVLGAACLVDTFGTAINVDAIATAGLVSYLVLAPMWACWLGAFLLHRAPPDRTAAEPRAVAGLAR